MRYLKSYKKFEDATTSSSTAGMGSVTSAQPGGLPGTTGTTGSGDVSTTFKKEKGKKGKPSEVSDLRDLDTVEIDKVDESTDNKYLKFVEMVDDIKDICLELQDNGFTIRVEPRSEIRLKMLSMKSNAYPGGAIESADIPFYVEIRLGSYEIKRFKISEVYETILQLCDYMKTKGFRCIINREDGFGVDAINRLNSYVELIIVTFKPI